MKFSMPGDGREDGVEQSHIQTAQDIFGVPGLEQDLARALARNEIEVLYQPQFSSLNGKLTGAEALARWEHPQLGMIGAGALFAIAERAGQVSQLSRHIARAALVPASGWPPHLRLSLNVTAADLALETFSERVIEVVDMSHFPTHRLTLEITEQAIVTGLYKVARKLELLVDHGMHVALDDFGAGFCNFLYLKYLPLHYLKLDRTMVDDLGDDPRDLAILRGIVAMAHALELDVIAEGIERESQRDIIAKEGCNIWQGFLGAAPMSTEEFAELATAQ